MGFLLLAMAGILAFNAESLTAGQKPLRGRFLTVDPAAANTGLSGTPSDSSSNPSNSFDNSIFGGNHKFTLAPFGIVGGDIIVYLVAGLVCGVYAWFYKTQVVDQIAPMPPQDHTGSDDFDVGICECFMDACMCFHLLIPCMVYVRQAHTNEVTGVCSFWATFWAYFLGGLCCGLGPCCLTVFFRMRLKEHMGIEDHLLNDLCCAWLCAPCAVGQAAMSVDRKLVYEVESWNNLKWLEDTEKVYRDQDDRYPDRR